MLQEYLAELRKQPLLRTEEEMALWELSARGDLQAHQKLMLSYQPLVFKIAVAFKLPETETMELIQEGMVGLLEAADSYDHTRKVAFSLFASYRIKGSMIDYLRSCSKNVDLSLESELYQGVTLADVLPSDACSPAEIFEQLAVKEKVEQALQRLPAKEQQVLQEIYIEDRTAQDVADTINVSLGHVYRLQKKGVRRIRGMLSRFMHDLNNS